MSLKLNIGSGADYRPNCINLEKFEDSTQHINKTAKPDVRADAHHLPFKDNVFDEIFILHTLEHLNFPLRGLEEMHRVMKPGAEATIHVPDVHNINGERPTHFYSWTQWSLDHICNHVGFEVLDNYRDNTSNGPTRGVQVRK